MVGGSRVGQSELGEQPLRGVLFRLSARLGALLFVGVIAVSVERGADLSAAFVRGLLALLALTVCGWLAEQVAHAATREEPPAPASVEATEAPDTTAPPAATSIVTDDESEPLAA